MQKIHIWHSASILKYLHSQVSTPDHLSWDQQTQTTPDWTNNDTMAGTWDVSVKASASYNQINCALAFKILEKFLIWTLSIKLGLGSTINPNSVASDRLLWLVKIYNPCKSQVILHTCTEDSICKKLANFLHT